MRKLTYTEWWQRVHDAYKDEPCPHCGRTHASVSPDDFGTVWLYCPNSDREYAIGQEIPPQLAEDDAGVVDDLPF